MNPAQFAQVSSLPAEQRYRHFLGKVADYEELWTLKGEDGFVLFASKDGAQCIPVWPHPEYASSHETDDWIGSTPEKITLDEFRKRWIPGIKKDERMIVVFPTHEAGGVVIDPVDIEADLADEVAQYE